MVETGVTAEPHLSAPEESSFVTESGTIISVCLLETEFLSWSYLKRFLLSFLSPAWMLVGDVLTYYSV